MALAAPAAAATATCARDAPRVHPPARALAAAPPPPPCRRRLAAARAPAPRASASAAFAVAAGGEIAEVGDLKGIRVSEAPPPPPAEGAADSTAAASAPAPPRRPLVEYLVEWKDGSPDTWEPASNLADDLLRDFEQRWWAAVRKGDDAVVDKLMDGGGATLSRTVDAERRSALHFAAALGRAPLARRLLAEGADANLADKDGYTPLHMAAGYMHTSTIAALLEGGADPEQADRKGRSPLELVESLRARLPPGGDPGAVARRVALEDVLRALTDNLFEDVEPAAVLAVRAARPPEAERARDAFGREVGAPATPEEEAAAAAAAKADASSLGREFLVKFPDYEAPLWLHERYVSADVAADFDSGLEYAEGKEVLDVRTKGDSRWYLVRWADGVAAGGAAEAYPDSWEPEERVAAALVAEFEAARAGAGGGAAEGARGEPAAA